MEPVESLLALAGREPSAVADAVQTAGVDRLRALGRAAAHDSTTRAEVAWLLVQAGERVVVKVANKPVTEPSRATRLDADRRRLVSPLSVALTRWDAALLRIEAARCMQRVIGRVDDVPYEVISLLRRDRHNRATIAALERWAPARMLARARRRALGLVSPSEPDPDYAISERVLEALEYTESELYEAGESRFDEDEREELGPRVESLKCGVYGLQHANHPDPEFVASTWNYALWCIERDHGDGDAAGERAWQWRRLADTLLLPDRVIAARLDNDALVDPWRAYAIARASDPALAGRLAQRVRLEA